MDQQDGKASCRSRQRIREADTGTDQDLLVRPGARLFKDYQIGGKAVTAGKTLEANILACKHGFKVCVNCAFAAKDVDCATIRQILADIRQNRFVGLGISQQNGGLLFHCQIASGQGIGIVQCRSNHDGVERIRIQSLLQLIGQLHCGFAAVSSGEPKYCAVRIPGGRDLLLPGCPADGACVGDDSGFTFCGQTRNSSFIPGMVKGGNTVFRIGITTVFADVYGSAFFRASGLPNLGYIIVAQTAAFHSAGIRSAAAATVSSFRSVLGAGSIVVGRIFSEIMAQRCAAGIHTAVSAHRAYIGGMSIMDTVRLRLRHYIRMIHPGGSDGGGVVPCNGAAAHIRCGI